MMTNTKRTKLIATFLLVLFFLVEFVFMGWMETITGYAAYFFEVLWISLILLIFKDFFWFSRKNIFRWLVAVLLVGILGAWVQILAFQAGIAIPFDFESKETIVFLLLIGPLLEEGVFRLGLWKLVETLLPRRWFLISVSGVLFSYSHFRVIGHLPPEVHDFIKYQTAYTLVLGVACGWLRSGYGFTAALLGHMLFNLGFWFAR